MKYFLIDVLRGLSRELQHCPAWGEGSSDWVKVSKPWARAWACAWGELWAHGKESLWPAWLHCHGEEEWCPCERGFFPAGAGTGMMMVTQACLCYRRQAGQTFLEHSEAHALPNGQWGFGRCMNSKLSLLLSRASAVQTVFASVLLCKDIKWCKYQQNSSLEFV